MCILDRAIDSVESEVKNSDDPNVKAIGSYLVDRVSEPGSKIAGLLLADGKSITSCVNYVINKLYQQAWQRRNPRCCVAIGAPGSQIYELAIEYYQSPEKDVALIAALLPAPTKMPDVHKRNSSKDKLTQAEPGQMENSRASDSQTAKPVFEQISFF